MSENENLKEYAEFKVEFKRVFEQRYQRVIEEKELEVMITRFIRFSCIYHNMVSKILGKKGIYEIYK